MEKRLDVLVSFGVCHPCSQRGGLDRPVQLCVKLAALLGQLVARWSAKLKVAGSTLVGKIIHSRTLRRQS